jgi:hypothetical protein
MFSRDVVLAWLAGQTAGATWQAVCEGTGFKPARAGQLLRELRIRGAALLVGTSPACVWAVPEHRDTALAAVNARRAEVAARERARIKERKRLMREQKLKYQKRPEGYEVDHLPMRQRVIPAAEAPPIAVRAVRSVFELGYE